MAKRIILTLISIIVLTTGAFAEKLPGSTQKISRENNPILCKYLTDYAILLNGKLKVPFYLPRDLGHWYIATYDRNGNLIDDNYDSKESSFMSKYIRKIVMKNPPPPLPVDLEGDIFTIEISLFKTSENLITFTNWIKPEYNFFLISIDKKNNFPRKVKPSEVYLDGYDKIPGVEEVDYVLIPGREQFYQPPPPRSYHPESK